MRNPIEAKRITPAALAAESAGLLAFGICMIVFNDAAAPVLRYGTSILLYISAGTNCVEQIKKRHWASAALAAVLLSIAATAILLSIAVFDIAFSVSLGFVFMVIGLLRLSVFGHRCYLKMHGRTRNLLGAIVCIVFAIILFAQPSLSSERALLVTGIGLIVYSVNLAIDALSELFLQRDSLPKTKNVTRIPLPTIFTAFLPGRFVQDFNDYFRSTGMSEGSIPQTLEGNSEVQTMLEILVHTGEKGIQNFGHVDLRINDEVLSYGTYDGHSVRFWGLVSDGTFVVAPFEPYIKICVEREDKVLVGFGIALNEDEKASVLAKVKSLEDQFVRFKSDYELWQDGELESWDDNDYACHLVKDAGAKLYKTPKGRFRTYYAVNTNCVKLADEIIEASGLTGLIVHGIPTPGEYLDNLNYLFERGNNAVVSRTIYTGEIAKA